MTMEQHSDDEDGHVARRRPLEKRPRMRGTHEEQSREELLSPRHKGEKSYSHNGDRGFVDSNGRRYGRLASMQRPPCLRRRSKSVRAEGRRRPARTAGHSRFVPPRIPTTTRSSPISCTAGAALRAGKQREQWGIFALTAIRTFERSALVRTRIRN